MKRFIKKPIVIISFLFFALLVSALQFTPPEIIYKIFIKPAVASNITNLSGSTGYVGKEDIRWGTGLDTDTYSVPTYSGGTITLTKLPSLFANAASIIKGKWYVAAMSGDHGNASLTGSLAWVINTLGADPATIELPGNQTYSLTTNLAIPETIVLNFQRGAILGGTANISGDGLKHIQAGAWQIFSTSGTITFPDGSDLKSSWFADFETAITKISTAKVSLEVTEADTITNDTTVNADTLLKWTGPGKILTISSSKTLTLNDLSGGLYQIFSGTGNVSFGTNPPDYARAEWWYSGSGSWDTAIEEAAESFCQTYVDSETQVQCGTVLLASKAYTVTDTITIRRPVKIKGEFVEFNSGPSRASCAGTRIVSNINNAAKDVFELIGTDRGDGNVAIFGTVLENFAINGASTERDGIRISATGHIYGLILRSIHIHDIGNNGVTVTSDNDSFSYSTFENIRCFSAGNDSFNLETGYAGDSTVGLRFTDCRSNTAGRYGFYAQLHGILVENFIEDLSATAGIYLKGVQRSTFQHCTAEQSSGYGFVLDASMHNNFNSCVSTNNVDDQYYFTGAARNNKFIGCGINKVGTEKHIEYDSSCRNNLWIGTQFYEAPDITDNGTRNVYLMNYDSSSSTEPGLEMGGSENFLWAIVHESFREKFATKTAAYTITAKDKYIYANASGGAFNVTLPTADNGLRGQEFCIKKIDSSANAVTVVGSIEGGNVTLSAQYNYVRVTCDGGTGLWWIVGQS